MIDYNISEQERELKNITMLLYFAEKFIRGEHASFCTHQQEEIQNCPVCGAILQQISSINLGQRGFLNNG